MREVLELRQFSYLMREVDMVEERLLDAAEFLASSQAEHLVLDTMVCRLVMPLVEGVRSRQLLLQWALCLARCAASADCAIARILQFLPSLAPCILSFLMTPADSAEVILLNRGLRVALLAAAQRLLSGSSADIAHELVGHGWHLYLSSVGATWEWCRS